MTSTPSRATVRHRLRGGPAVGFAQRLVHLQSLLDQRIAPALAARGITRADLDVLGALLTAGRPYELRPKDLSDRLLLTTGGLSNVLRRLETRGLLTRATDGADARGRRVRLTAAGVTLADDVTAAVAAILRDSLAGVPAATLRSTRDALDAVTVTLDDRPR